MLNSIQCIHVLLVEYKDTKEHLKYFCQKVFLRPYKGFWEQGKKGIYFSETGEQRQKVLVNRGTKTILGNREHKKTNFRFLGNRGTSQFISEEQWNRYPLGVPLSSYKLS